MSHTQLEAAARVAVALLEQQLDEGVRRTADVDRIQFVKAALNQALESESIEQPLAILRLVDASGMWLYVGDFVDKAAGRIDEIYPPCTGCAEGRVRISARMWLPAELGFRFVGV